MWPPAAHLEAENEDSVGSSVELSVAGAFLDPPSNPVCSARPSALVWVWSV